MNSTETLDSIREINLAYISLAQRLLHEDSAMGMARLGLSPKLADVMTGLSLSQIGRLAATPQLLCTFRCCNHTILSTLTHVDEPVDAARAQTPILLTGQQIEQCA